MSRITNTDINLTEIAAEFPGRTDYQGDAPPHSMSEFYGEAGSVPATGELKFSDFAGKVGIFEMTLNDHAYHINVRDAAISSGWDQVVTVRFIIPAGIYAYSVNTGIPAITTGSFPRGLIIQNNGYIMGCGGNGGETLSIGTLATSGGPAISLGTYTLLNNSGYIGGGGGGGDRGPYEGGGGGAGGGIGGRGSFGTVGGGGGGLGGYGGAGSGVNGGIGGSGGSAGGGGGQGVNYNKGSDGHTGGGGGGRILPGSAKASAGGYGGGPNQSGQSVTGFTGPGGGGWGAAGGINNTGSPGAGGRAVVLNGNTLVIGYGAERIYGAYT